MMSYSHGVTSVRAPFGRPKDKVSAAGSQKTEEREMVDVTNVNGCPDFGANIRMRPNSLESSGGRAKRAPGSTKTRAVGGSASGAGMLRREKTQLSSMSGTSTGSRDVKSRGRPRKENEPDPFLSVDNLPEGKVQSEPFPVPPKKRKQVMLDTEDPSLSRNAGKNMFKSPAKSTTAMSSYGPSRAAFVPPSSKGKTANHQMRSPFKHAVNKPQMEPPSVDPGEDLKERTAYATYQVAMILGQEPTQPEKKAPGQRWKGRLQPLYPVRVDGPSIYQCRGIQPEPRQPVFSGVPSHTVQRRAQIVATYPELPIYGERPQTVESVHNTSRASSMADITDPDLLLQMQEDTLIDQPGAYPPESGYEDQYDPDVMMIDEDLAMEEDLEIAAVIGRHRYDQYPQEREVRPGSGGSDKENVEHRGSVPLVSPQKVVPIGPVRVADHRPQTAPEGGRKSVRFADEHSLYNPDDPHNRSSSAGLASIRVRQELPTLQPRPQSEHSVKSSMSDIHAPKSSPRSLPHNLQMPSGPHIRRMPSPVLSPSHLSPVPSPRPGSRESRTPKLGAQEPPIPPIGAQVEPQERGGDMVSGGDIRLDSGDAKSESSAAIEIDAAGDGRLPDDSWEAVKSRKTPETPSVTSIEALAKDEVAALMGSLEFLEDRIAQSGEAGAEVESTSDEVAGIMESRFQTSTQQESPDVELDQEEVAAYMESLGLVENVGDQKENIQNTENLGSREENLDDTADAGTQEVAAIMESLGLMDHGDGDEIKRSLTPEVLEELIMAERAVPMVGDRTFEEIYGDQVPSDEVLEEEVEEQIVPENIVHMDGDRSFEEVYGTEVPSDGRVGDESKDSDGEVEEPEIIPEAASVLVIESDQLGKEDRPLAVSNEPEEVVIVEGEHDGIDESGEQVPAADDGPTPVSLAEADSPPAAVLDSRKDEDASYEEEMRLPEGEGSTSPEGQQAEMDGAEPDSEGQVEQGETQKLDSQKLEQKDVPKLDLQDLVGEDEVTHDVVVKSDHDLNEETLQADDTQADQDPDVGEYCISPPGSGEEELEGEVDAEIGEQVSGEGAGALQDGGEQAAGQSGVEGKVDTEVGLGEQVSGEDAPALGEQFSGEAAPEDEGEQVPGQGEGDVHVLTDQEIEEMIEDDTEGDDVKTETDVTLDMDIEQMSGTESRASTLKKDEGQESDGEEEEAEDGQEGDETGGDQDDHHDDDHDDAGGNEGGGEEGSGDGSPPDDADQGDQNDNGGDQDDNQGDGGDDANGDEKGDDNDEEEEEELNLEDEERSGQKDFEQKDEGCVEGQGCGTPEADGANCGDGNGCGTPEPTDGSEVATSAENLVKVKPSRKEGCRPYSAKGRSSGGTSQEANYQKYESSRISLSPDSDEEQGRDSSPERSMNFANVRKRVKRGRPKSAVAAGVARKSMKNSSELRIGNKVTGSTEEKKRILFRPKSAAGPAFSSSRVSNENEDLVNLRIGKMPAKDEMSKRRPASVAGRPMSASVPVKDERPPWGARPQSAARQLLVLAPKVKNKTEPSGQKVRLKVKGLKMKSASGVSLNTLKCSYCGAKGHRVMDYSADTGFCMCNVCYKKMSEEPESKVAESVPSMDRFFENLDESGPEEVVGTEGAEAEGVQDDDDAVEQDDDLVLQDSEEIENEVSRICNLNLEEKDENTQTKVAEATALESHRSAKACVVCGLEESGCICEDTEFVPDSDLLSKISYSHLDNVRDGVKKKRIAEELKRLEDMYGVYSDDSESQGEEEIDDPECSTEPEVADLPCGTLSDALTTESAKKPPRIRPSSAQRMSSIENGKIVLLEHTITQDGTTTDSTEPDNVESLPGNQRVDQEKKLEVVATAKTISKQRGDDSAPVAPYPPLCFKINARPPQGYLYYFAYGTDMNAERLQVYLGREMTDRFWGLLYGFKLVFNKRGTDAEAGGFANIEFNPYSSVEGCLYLITPAELDILDKYVGYPEHYEHAMFPTWLLNCNEPDLYGVAQYCVPALTYVAQDRWTQKPTDPALSTEYNIRQCLRNADLLTPGYKQYLQGQLPDDEGHSILK